MEIINTRKKLCELDESTLDVYGQFLDVKNLLYFLNHFFKFETLNTSDIDLTEDEKFEITEAVKNYGKYQNLYFKILKETDALDKAFNELFMAFITAEESGDF